MPDRNPADRLYRFQGRRPPEPGQRTPVRAEAPTSTVSDEGVATLRLYDPIDSWGGYWGISASEMAAALDELVDVERIELHINSPGGEVFEGLAILNLLRQHPANVTAVVDGLAASAASFIAAGADETVMARNTDLMIHDAWGICVGDAGLMRDTAARLDHLSDNIASIYAEKAGGSTADWRDAMLAETWYSADEAVAAGLADRVDGAADGAEAKARVDLSVFAHAGRADAPPPPAPPAPAPVPDQPAAQLSQLQVVRHRMTARRHGLHT